MAKKVNKQNRSAKKTGNINPVQKKINDEPPPQPNILSEPEIAYKSKSVIKFSSFEEMENDQLSYFASLQPAELLQNLKQMVLGVFGFREEPPLNSLPRIVHFNEEQ